MPTDADVDINGHRRIPQNSSRSHTIFRMVIESRSRSSKGGRSVMSTLSLVDLAGSESVRLANTHGQRQIEGGFINKSLLTLGKVVSMLTEEGKSGMRWIGVV